ncbi:MAG: hypothetical protein ACHP9T_09100 [Caulobacterales bacterium]
MKTANNSATPTFNELISLANALLETGATAAGTEAEALKIIVDRLLDPTRVGTPDFSDPAISGLSAAL